MKDDKLLEKYLINDEGITSRNTGDGAYTTGGVVTKEPKDDETQYIKRARKYRKEIYKDTAEKISKIIGGKFDFQFE